MADTKLPLEIHVEQQPHGWVATVYRLADDGAMGWKVEATALTKTDAAAAATALALARLDQEDQP